MAEQDGERFAVTELLYVLAVLATLVNAVFPALLGLFAWNFIYLF